MIFVSVPDFSPLLIAYWLKRLTGCSLVLDMRDDWDENPYYHQRYWYARKLVTYWEHMVVSAADKVILVTEPSLNSYRRRYPQFPDKFILLPNGYDPKIDAIMANKPPLPTDKFRIVHSGVIPTERVIPALFCALQELLTEHPEMKTDLKLVFLGNVCIPLKELVSELGLNEYVEFCGNLPYEENIRRVAQASLLLLIPSLNIPNSLPGKVYEYLAVKRPFLAITEDNITRKFLSGIHYKDILYPTDKAGMKEAILNFYRQFKTGELTDCPAFADLKDYNRAEQTRKLAQIFSEVVGH